jgi:hypothetical protein
MCVACMHVCIIYVCMYVCMYLCIYVCVYKYVCIIYVYMNVRTYVYIYVYMYACMHLFSSIPTNKQDFFHKYLCNFITELHNVTNCVSADSYCSCCTVLPSYSNVN